MSNSIAKLGDYMPDDLKKKKKNFDYVEPVYLKKLYRELGSHAEVGDKIGISVSQVSLSLREKRARVVNELAARHVWERDFAADAASASEERTAVIVAAPHVIKTVKDLISGLGGQCHVIPKSKGEN